MNKVLRVARTVLLDGTVALSLATSPALVTCPSPILITQGTGGRTLDAATFGTTLSSLFWLIGSGAPAVGASIDNGSAVGLVNPINGGGQYWTSDWGEAWVNGCPITQLQPDGTLGPMAVAINYGAGEDTSLMVRECPEQTFARTLESTLKILSDSEMPPISSMHRHRLRNHGKQHDRRDGRPVARDMKP